MTEDGRALLERYFQAITDRDWETLAAIRAADFAEEWPQSNERIVGNDNWRLVHENFPGYPDIQKGKVEGADPTYVVSPVFTLVRISGAGDAWVVQGVNKYPDGSNYHIVKLIELTDGKVHAETTYFAERSDPPSWRAQWVEPLRTS